MKNVYLIHELILTHPKYLRFSKDFPSEILLLRLWRCDSLLMLVKCVAFRISSLATLHWHVSLCTLRCCFSNAMKKTALQLFSWMAWSWIPSRLKLQALYKSGRAACRNSSSFSPISKEKQMLYEVQKYICQNRISRPVLPVKSAKMIINRTQNLSH